MAQNPKLETNKKIARQFFEAFGKNDFNTVETLLSSNYKLRITGKSEALNKTESIEFMKTYINAFPDLKFTIECQIAEGDFVTTRISGTGTHQGEFQGTAPTNKKVKVTGNTIHKITNNTITEEWTEFDALSLLTQIGVVPELATMNGH